MRQITLQPNYDVIIVGGGIQGCAMLWEAQSRGLNALLLEANDYCALTSANSLKTIHGGIRYLQSLNFKRTIDSAREQETLLAIAPHLIKPLDCLLPTEKSLKRSRLAVSMGFALYNLVKSIFCRQKTLAKAKWIDKQKLCQLERRFNDYPITGAGQWQDAQVQHTEKLGLAFVKAAKEAGADAYNYLKVDKIDPINEQSFKVALSCQITQQTFDLSADSVILTAGSRNIAEIADFLKPSDQSPKFCMAVNLVVRGRCFDVALGLDSGFADKQQAQQKGLLFCAPWRKQTLFGTWYFEIAEQSPGSDLMPTEQQIASCLTQINSTYPGLSIQRSDVIDIHRGFLPLTGAANDLQLRESSKIICAEKSRNFIMVFPTKYTTCRAVAEKTIDQLSMSLNKNVNASSSARQQLIVGDAEDSAKLKRNYADVPAQILEQLFENYADQAAQVVEFCKQDQRRLELIPGSNDHLKGQLEYELSQGQVLRLDDFTKRRTYLFADEKLNTELVDYCSNRISEYHL